jgi:hypothetical protein
VILSFGFTFRSTTGGNQSDWRRLHRGDQLPFSRKPRRP